MVDRRPLRDQSAGHQITSDMEPTAPAAGPPPPIYKHARPAAAPVAHNSFGAATYVFTYHKGRSSTNVLSLAQHTAA